MSSAFSKAISSSRVGIAAADPTTYIFTVSVLVAISLSACIIPAVKQVACEFSHLYRLSADKPFHDVPGSVKSFPFHTSVVKMEFVLAGGTLPFDELREMQSAGRGGFALPRSQAA